MTSLSDFLQYSQQRINQQLIHALSEQGSEFVTISHSALEKLREASIYSIGNGGKRLRPALVYAVAQALGQLSEKNADLIAAALECIHSYSLVHDDLPAMDDDDLRRGKPACHIAFDEATAILVGDGLQAFAFELLSGLSLKAEISLKLVRYLAQAAGSFGMVGGQMIDLQAVNSLPDIHKLEQMHRLKTGALIKAAVIMPALASEAPSSAITALSQYSQALGLAFQVQDDILDIEADTATLGKTQGKDQQDNKPTYPRLLGLEGAKNKAQTLIDQAHQALDTLDYDCQQLHALADFVLHRSY